MPARTAQARPPPRSAAPAATAAAPASRPAAATTAARGPATTGSVHTPAARSPAVSLTSISVSRCAVARNANAAGGAVARMPAQPCGRGGRRFRGSNAASRAAAWARGGRGRRTAPAVSAPASGDSAMMAATVAVLTPVSRFSSGVYASVAAAENAMIARSSGGSCARRAPLA